MSVNLVDIGRQYFNSDVISKAGSMLGENGTNVQKAIDAGIPSVLAGLLQNVSSDQSGNKLMSLLNSGNFDGSMLNNISGLFSGDSGSAVMKTGDSLLNTLLGDKKDKVSGLVSSASGIRDSSASSLLSLLAPMMMNLLGKQKSSLGLNATGLLNLLSSQKEVITKFAPTGLADALGLSSLSDLGGNFLTGTEKGDAFVLEKKKSKMRWVWPVLIIAAALLVLWYFKKGSHGSKSENNPVTLVDTLTNKANNIADSAASTVDSVVSDVSNFFRTRLPNGKELNMEKGGTENKLLAFIQNPSRNVDADSTKNWLSLDRTTFKAGTDTLTPASMEQVQNIAEILKAYPNTKVKIGGYTDNTGNAKTNLKLSAERAKVVMDLLIASGIDSSRIESEGYGNLHPVSSNKTEEGRQQNRRIALRVLEK